MLAFFLMNISTELACLQRLPISTKKKYSSSYGYLLKWNPLNFQKWSNKQKNPFQSVPNISKQLLTHPKKRKVGHLKQELSFESCRLASKTVFFPFWAACHNTGSEIKTPKAKEEVPCVLILVLTRVSSAAVIKSRYCLGCKSDRTFSAEGYELGQ